MRGDALNNLHDLSKSFKDMVYIDLRDQNNLPEIKSKVYGLMMGNLKIKC